jgi:2-dehydro-3-deoxy-D-gluconate 5-dehydrogenase
VSTLAVAQLVDLSGQVAIVTGAGNGIGQGIALRLGEAGATIIVLDIDFHAAQRTADAIIAAGGKACARLADASSIDDARKVCETVLERYGRLDILVNNAGIYSAIPLLEMTPEDWDKLHDLDLRGLFFFSQAAARAMIQAGNGGRIVHIASLASVHPVNGMPHYDSAKAGVNVLAKSMALALADHKILVNAIIPGTIVTPGIAALAAEKGVGPDQYLFDICGGEQRFPLHRCGRPDDIARATLFLVSGLSDYISGTTTVVDGGYLLT